MRFLPILLCLLSCALLPARTLAGGTPAETVAESEQVLAEIMAIPAKQIPEGLLAQAQGIAIIPNVIKIGFIAGARRGHGVVLVRDPDGEWSLPQFITLTGGSVGWQAGIQGTDVVLVFTTRKGVDSLMHGKFTVGVDAAASAGPVGRNAAAATDATLKSEILSYSRSRGLFLGVSIDGSVLEIDNEAHAAYYGSQSSELPRQIPQSASQLRQYLVYLTTPATTLVAPAGSTPTPAPAPTLASNKVETIRRALAQNSKQLQSILSPPWQQYLALPKSISGAPDPSARPDELKTALARYDRVAKSPDYKQLNERPEFQATHELLQEYAKETSSASSQALKLPPPPPAN